MSCSLESIIFIGQFLLLESAPVYYCDQPAPTLHAYQEHLASTSTGAELLSLSLDESIGNEVEWCQWHCDSMDSCSGFERDTERCVLKMAGPRITHQGTVWFQKVN